MFIIINLYQEIRGLDDCCEVLKEASNGALIVARPKKDSSKSPFPKLLKALLDERRVSQRQAAKVAGVSAATINGWLSGVSPEDYLAIQRLAKFLGTTMSYILTGQNDAYSVDQQPTISELFSEGLKVSGIYKIQVTQLLPRSGESDDNGDDS